MTIPPSELSEDVAAWLDEVAGAMYDAGEMYPNYRPPPRQAERPVTPRIPTRGGTRPLTDQQWAVVRAVDAMLRQIPRPLVDDACREVGAQHGVPWSTVCSWRKRALRLAHGPQPQTDNGTRPP